MKKLIITLTLLSAAIAAGAQQFYDTPGIARGQFYFSFLDHIGWGMAVPQIRNVDAAIFGSNTTFGKNREFFVNLGTIEYVPVPGASISTGMDLNWSTYRLNKNYYWDTYNYGTAVTAASIDGVYSKVNKSFLRVFSVDMPIDFNIRLGAFLVSAGITGEMNFPAIVRFKGVDTSGNKEKWRESGIDSELLTMNLHAMVSWYGYGLFVRYRPTPQILEESGPYFSTWTFGLYIR